MMQTLTLGQVGFALSREPRARVEGDAQAIAVFKAKAAQIALNFAFTSYTLREATITANDQLTRAWWRCKPRPSGLTRRFRWRPEKALCSSMSLGLCR
jgi:hypothetical protein